MVVRSLGAIEAAARGCNWFGYVLLPLWLSPSQFGAFSFLLALVLLVSALGTAGQDRVILRYISAKAVTQNPGLISTAFITCLVCTLFSFSLTYYVLDWLDMKSSLAIDYKWVLLWGVAQSLYMLLIALCRSLDRHFYFVILRMVYGVTKLVLLILIAMTTTNVAYLIMLEVSLLLVVICVALVGLRHYFVWPSAWNIWQKAWLFGLPLILHILAGASLGQLDKLMIANMLNSAMLGMYAFINSIAGGVFFIFAVINVMYEAKVYQLGVSIEAEKLLSKMFRLSMLSAAIALLFVNLSLAEILTWVQKQHYYHFETIVILSIAYLIYPLYLQANIRFALKEKTQVIPIMTGTAAIANVIFNLVLIPIYGIVGAAISTLLAYIILVTLAQWASRRV
ncbi:oligosaccharide flippase family protein [Paraglaciecola aestuariivivens]